MLALQNNSAENGVSLVLKTYANDNNYSDEWYLPQHSSYSNVFLGPEDGDPKIVPILARVENAFRTAGMIGHSVTAIEKYQAIEYLASSDVFISYSHGEPNHIILTDTVLLTSDDINALDSSALSELKLACFVACLTGTGKETAPNFVNAIHSRGAQNIIGFTTIVDAREAYVWIEAFGIAIAEGQSIQAALDAADDAIMTCYVAGTTSNRYEVGDMTSIPCPQ